MIKEKKKPKLKKSFAAIAMEYLKTIAISFSAALIFTLLLSFHARSEMIKNIYMNAEEQQKIDEKIARQLVTQSDLTKDLKTKKYSICIQVGNLYETIQDYKNAEFAYRLAIQKAKPGVYAPYYKLACVLISQERFNDAELVLKSVKDIQNKKLIKFKTRAYIVMGDKYYSIGKFLSAAKSYEKARFYYDKFAKKDPVIDKEIDIRIINAYKETADIMVKNGYNSDAVSFLKKAEKYAPNDLLIKYKLAIIYSDLDPIKSIEYFEPLLEEIPQKIDYGAFGKALMKAANIADLEGNPTQAKYYRYKIHSVDLFINQKVIYPNDIEIILDSFIIRKPFFKYSLKAKYRFRNVSNGDIIKMSADFNLRQNDKVLETITKPAANKNAPLFSNGGETGEIEVNFGKNIFTKRELEQYVIDIYVYKDEKYKTLAGTMKVPLKSFYSSK